MSIDDTFNWCGTPSSTENSYMLEMQGKQDIQELDQKLGDMGYTLDVNYEVPITSTDGRSSNFLYVFSSGESLTRVEKNVETLDNYVALWSNAQFAPFTETD